MSIFDVNKKWLTLSFTKLVCGGGFNFHTYENPVFFSDFKDYFHQNDTHVISDKHQKLYHNPIHMKDG